MGRSTRFNKLFFYRRTTFSFSISLLLLTPILAQGAESIYDQHVLQAREGNYSPFLDYLQQYQQQHALTPEQVADWLQVASWAGSYPGVAALSGLYGATGTWYGSSGAGLP